SDPPACGSLTSGVWFVLTPCADGTVTMSTCGSDFDTVLGVFTGDCGSLTQIACDDNSCGAQSSLSFFALSGTAYTVLAGGANNEFGTLRILTTQVSP